MKKICVNCGCRIKENEELFTVDNEVYCEDCFYNTFIECTNCGELVHIDDTAYIDGGYVCSDCLSEDYRRCNDCGEYHHIDNMYLATVPYTWGYYICENCFSDNYSYCDSCGRIFSLDNGYYCNRDGCWYCDECMPSNEFIQAYHEFNDWYNFYVNDCNESILKGFELEIENLKGCYYDNDLAQKIDNIMNDFVVFEQDSSLEDGFEIISNPFTMEYMYKHLNKFEEMFDVIKKYGFGESDTAGLHIHVNRNQLSLNTNLTEDEVIDNILIIMEVFKNELIDFSRREYYNLREWAEFLTDGDTKVKKAKIDAKKGKDRYMALNLKNRNTIEFRIFKSTDDLKTFIATVELVDNIVNIAKSGNIDGLTWNDIIATGKFLKEVSNKLNVESDTVLVIDDVMGETKVECTVVDGFEDIPLNVDGIILKKGAKVRYKGYYGVVLDSGRYGQFLLGLDNWNGHSGNGLNNYNIPPQYENHCWWVTFNEFEVI